MKHLRSISIALASIGLCGAVHVREPLSELPAQFPPGLGAQVIQEVRVGKPKKVRLGDVVTLALVGELLEEPVFAPDLRMWTLRSNIGTKVPMECRVFEQLRLLGDVIQQIQTGTMAAVEQSTGKSLSVRHPYFVVGGAIGDAPYLASEWLYGFGELDSLEVRMLKARSAHKDGATILCTHDEVGYHLAFQRVFDKLVDDAKVSTDHARPEYREIFELQVGDRPIGVTWIEMTAKPDDMVQINYNNSYFYPDANQTLVANDHMLEEQSSKDGALASAHELSVVNGAPATALSIAPTDNGGWHVDGQAGEDTVDRKFTDPNKPISEYGQRLLLQDVIKAGNKKHRTFYYWDSAADAKKMGTGGFRLIRKSSKSQIWFSVGELRGVGRFDKRGSLVDGKLSHGKATTEMTRVWTGGKLP